MRLFSLSFSFLASLAEAKADVASACALFYHCCESDPKGEKGGGSACGADQAKDDCQVIRGISGHCRLSRFALSKSWPPFKRAAAEVRRRDSDTRRRHPTG